MGKLTCPFCGCALILSDDGFLIRCGACGAERSAFDGRHALWHKPKAKGADE